MQKREAKDQRGITNRSIKKNYGGVTQSGYIGAGPKGTSYKPLSPTQKIQRAQQMRWLVTSRLKKSAKHIAYLLEKKLIAPFEKGSKYHTS